MDRLITWFAAKVVAVENFVRKVKAVRHWWRVKPWR
jgi:hypothetical protein